MAAIISGVIVSVLSLCKDRVDVEYPTWSKVNGARVATYNVRYSSQPCRLQLASVVSKDEHGREQQRLEGKCYFHETLTIASQDRLKFGTRYLEVYGAVDIDEWSRLMTVFVREVKG